MVTLNLFYLLAGIALISSIMVISARNPVHSVLFLILAFFNAAGLLILMEMEFLFLIFFIIEGDFVSFNGQANSIYLDWFQQVDVVSNIETLGQVLYTEYLVYFLLAGVILLVAMVGAIVLTMSTRTSLRRQLIFQQVSRDFDNSTLLV